jgi:hypothetical protein
MFFVFQAKSAKQGERSGISELFPDDMIDDEDTELIQESI